MNTTKRKIVLALAYLVAATSIAKAQPGTLEMTLPGNTTNVQGPSVAPVVVNMWQDDLNLTAGTTFRPSSPALTATVALSNQQYTNSYGAGTPGAISSGIVFGGGNSASNTGTVQQSANYLVYNVLGAYLPQPPQNGMFVSSPTGAPVANWQAGGRGVGLDVEQTQGGHDISGDDDVNTGIAVFTNVEPLFDANANKAGRFYYGDITITFNRPVLNPVVHIGGLGGSYAYQPNVANSAPQISYFSTELELQNTGVTSTFMAGSEYFSISGNKILNSSPTPNAGSYYSATSTILGFNTYGAATGSVRVNGTVTQLTYKVYVRGSANSNFNFSQSQANISGATRRPLNGDLFYVAVSLDKPNQQISGTVFNDRDGLTDNNINQTAGVANLPTNVSGALYANLLNTAGLAVAGVAVNADGTYLFNNVAIGTYTVQLTNVASTGTYANPVAAPATTLPAGWVNTGEFIGKTAGTDGTVDSKSSASIIVLGTIVTDVNFGIERTPLAIPYSSFIKKPGLNTYLNLYDTLPKLSGSDPEDMPATAYLKNRKVQITTIPTNSVLQYNGMAVTAGQIIANYDSSKLRILFNQPSPNTSQTDFYYSYIDSAGKASPPAHYLIAWTAGGPLAVTLESFTAIGTDCSARINWIATNELNLASYVVEVSTNNQTNFVTAGTVTPRGGSSSESYQTTYSMQNGVVYYYRLKMVDFDGTVSYSAIRTLSCGGKATIVIAPNPVIDQFRITGLANGKNTVVVYGADGKMMTQQFISGNSGTVNISRFTAGTYVVKVIAADGTDFSAEIIKR